jgi:exodeoxyribonuclease V alpha subunit
MEQELLELSGTVENIVFRNDNNGWTVFELDSGDELITAVGLLFQVLEGDKISVKGEWVNHPNYGRQFKVESYEKDLPASEDAMLKYLSSGAVKGIGPATAKRIIDVFGKDTLKIIENTPEQLVKVKGISPKKAQAISEEYKQQFGVRSCMLFLQQYGVTPAEAVRIWQSFGSNAVEMVKSDPYILCKTGLSISFERADTIAASMGFETDNKFRVRAGLMHIMRHNLYTSGHTYIPEEKLLPTAKQMLDVSDDDVSDALKDLLDDNDLDSDEIGGRHAIFLHEAYCAETYAAGRLRLMMQMVRPMLGDCSKRIEQAEERFGIKYAQRQKDAIEAAYTKGVMILTGGPGTGKTTTINAIIAVYEGMGLKVSLAAPTGRAAKRMTEVSGKEAKTIHRLLEVEYTEDDIPKFARNERNQLDCDALIVDEMSMVDIMLFEALLRALKLSCRLVMVGDADQLPPVGPGNALRDMIDSGAVPVVKLDEIFRQAAQSLIITNAHRIVRGEQPDLSKRNGDFFFMPRFTQQQVKKTVTDLVKTRLPAAYGYSPLWDIQVLTPGRKGELGANDLNTVLQNALNPPQPDKPERQFGTRIFRQGDKVMQIKNNYDIVWEKDGEHGTGIFNGDIGVIEMLDRRSGMMRIRFDDRNVDYPPECMNQIELAYAATVHKSQGSEFRAVILPLFSGAPQLFYRNLLYTAVTRAKEIVIIVGREETVSQMVLNDKKTKRYTGMCEFLKSEE